MTIAPAVLDALLAHGCSAEQIVAAVKADAREGEDATAARREKERLRKRAQREAKKNADTMVASVVSQGQDGTAADGEGQPAAKESPQTPKENKTEPQKENTPLRGVQKKKGHRLPSDFAMPDDWRDWAVQRGLPPHRVPVEFEKLTNWAANAAGNGVKSDWFKAWQNWVISAIDSLPQNRAPPASQAAPSMSQLLTAIRDHPHENQPGPAEDRSGFRAAIPHLRAVGAG